MTERASILIVEDEAIVALDLQQTLNDDHYDAYAIAASADEALACATERLPDLVLMDIRIKGVRDGVETAELLRASFGVPVVFLTAHADDSTLDRAKRTSPYGYLHKPVKPAALRSMIEIALYNHAMERQARLRERWFATTLRSIADAVICVDLGGKVNYMNPPAEELTGVSSEHALGKPVVDVVEFGNVNESVPALQALHAREIVGSHEATLKNKTSGHTHVITDSAAPVIDDQEMLGAVMVFRDVTKQKLLQQRVEFTDRLASLGTLAAGVAHEVNNPLAAVLSNAQYVLSAMAKAKAKGDPAVSALVDAVTDPLADVEAAATRIARIVADLRAFSRVENDGQANVVDVTRALQWALRTTAHEHRLRARVVTSFSPVPPVAGDETKLGQVFINLLVNAAHAIEPGNADKNEVTISTSTDSAGNVVIVVSDTGCGMSPDVRLRIFEPFFTTKPIGKGTGLGLSISHGIIGAMGGTLELDSTVGVGTTVRIVLPRTAMTKPVEGRRAGPLVYDGRGRILIIDDEPLVLRLMSRVLGPQVVCTERARAALDLLDQGEHFDVILCDLNMPVMTGVDFYEEVLKRFPEVAPRVAFLTGGTLPGRTSDFLSAVSNLRLQKPFDNVDLQRLVVQVLESATPGV